MYVWLKSTSVSEEPDIYVFNVPTLKIEEAGFSETYEISSRLHVVPEYSIFISRRWFSRDSPPNFWIVYFEGGCTTFIRNVYISLHGVTLVKTVVLRKWFYSDSLEEASDYVIRIICSGI